MYKSAPNMKETGHDHWFEHSQLWDKLVLACYFAWGSPSLLFTPLLKLSYPTERTSVLSQQVPHQRCRALILASGTSRISIKIKKKKLYWVQNKLVVHQPNPIVLLTVIDLLYICTDMTKRGFWLSISAKPGKTQTSSC